MTTTIEIKYFKSGWELLHYKYHFATNIEIKPLLTLIISIAV